MSDPAIKGMLADGGAYAIVSEGLVKSLSDRPALQGEVLQLYETRLQ